jgi:CMP-N-acetylneuraminic acid synthetase
LFHHILNTLGLVQELSGIWINTDSPEIKQGVQDFFPGVQLINRPDSLCGDLVSMNKILLHDVRQIDADIYLQTHSTNPLLKASTISKALRFFKEHRSEYDSLFSVTRLQTRLWDQDGNPLNHDPSSLIQTQDLPPVYEENSCLYIFTRESLEKGGTRIGRKPYLFEIPPEEAWDIDTRFDFEVTELFLKNRSE